MGPTTHVSQLCTSTLARPRLPSPVSFWKLWIFCLALVNWSSRERSLPAARDPASAWPSGILGRETQGVDVMGEPLNARTPAGGQKSNNVLHLCPRKTKTVKHNGRKLHVVLGCFITPWIRIKSFQWSNNLSTFWPNSSIICRKKSQNSC